jgi:hypothetical protein
VLGLRVLFLSAWIHAIMFKQKWSNSKFRVLGLGVVFLLAWIHAIMFKQECSEEV